METEKPVEVKLIPGKIWHCPDCGTRWVITGDPIFKSGQCSVCGKHWKFLDL